ncbi:hypothetical protein FRC08_014699, partial [Ceratobasidium sp. 394]
MRPHQLSRVITALMCLARADATLLGYSPRFRENGVVVTSSTVEGAHFVCSPNINSPDTDMYPLHDVISPARALHVQCSRVLGSTANNQDVALKLSRQVVTRTNEAHVIEQAHERGIDGVIKV